MAMKFKDLREFILFLEERGELRRITAPVSWDLEISEIADRMVKTGGPALLFDNVTGYGILGHSYEMAAAGKVALRLIAGRVPLLPGALEYASKGIVTGGADRNRKHLQDKVSFAEEVNEEMRHILFDPQTSGGLLMAVAPEKADEVEARFAADKLTVWQIGEVVKGEGVQVMP